MQTEIADRLESICAAFVRDVVATLGTMSMTDLAKLVSSSSARPVPSVVTTPTTGTTALAATRPRPSKKGQRRNPAAMAELRERIVSVLRASTTPMGAIAIGHILHQSTRNLTFPLAGLRKKGIVKMKGTKSWAVYSIAKG